MTDQLPADERIDVLRDYGARYDLRVFIETGTANGDTPAALASSFDTLYTIEIDPIVYGLTANRFVGTNVVTLLGDSTVVLPKVLDAVGPTPALVWLDGHFCGGARGTKDTPVIEELAAVLRTGVPHVILIDDVRLFEGMPGYGPHDWPHIDLVCALGAAAHYDWTIADDIMRLVPA
jgi:hypothetical protein